MSLISCGLLSADEFVIIKHFIAIDNDFLFSVLEAGRIFKNKFNNFSIFLVHIYLYYIIFTLHNILS